MSQELEQARKAAIRNRMIRWGVCVGLPLLAAIPGIIEKNWKLAIGAFVILAYILFGLWAAFSKNRPLANYRALFKKEMIELALNGATLYEKTEFAFDRGLNPSLVSGSGMFTTNRYLSDCYISGVHNGVQFYQADIRNVAGNRNGWIYIFMPNKKSVLRPKLFTQYNDSMKVEILKELELAKHFIDAFR